MRAGIATSHTGVVGRLLKLCRGEDVRLWPIFETYEIPSFSGSNSHSSFMKYSLSFHRLCVCFYLSCCWRTVLKVFWQLLLEEEARHVASVTPADAIMSPASMGYTDLITQWPRLIFIPSLPSQGGLERQGGSSSGLEKLPVEIGVAASSSAVENASELTFRKEQWGVLVVQRGGAAGRRKPEVGEVWVSTL